MGYTPQGKRRARSYRFPWRVEYGACGQRTSRCCSRAIAKLDGYLEPERFPCLTTPYRARPCEIMPSGRGRHPCFVLRAEWLCLLRSAPVPIPIDMTCRVLRAAHQPLRPARLQPLRVRRVLGLVARPHPTTRELTRTSRVALEGGEGPSQPGTADRIETRAQLPTSPALPKRSPALPGCLGKGMWAGTSSLQLRKTSGGAKWLEWPLQGEENLCGSAQSGAAICPTSDAAAHRRPVWEFAGRIQSHMACLLHGGNLWFSRSRLPDCCTILSICSPVSSRCGRDRSVL